MRMCFPLFETPQYSIWPDSNKNKTTLKKKITLNLLHNLLYVVPGGGAGGYSLIRA